MPREFAARLPEFEIHHVIDCGWRHVKNGELLKLAEIKGFKALLTKDGNMPYQQNLTGRTIALLILRPRTQLIDDLLELAIQIPLTLKNLQHGEVRLIRADNIKG